MTQDCYLEIPEQKRLVAQALALINWWAEANGYRKLADDQSLPIDPYDLEWGVYRDSQRDMLRVVDGKAFRKVEVKE